MDNTMHNCIDCLLKFSDPEELVQHMVKMHRWALDSARLWVEQMEWKQEEAL